MEERTRTSVHMFMVTTVAMEVKVIRTCWGHVHTDLRMAGFHYLTRQYML